MGKTEDDQPQPVSEDTINQWLHSIGLPKALSISSKPMKVIAEFHDVYKISLPPNDKTKHTELILRTAGRHLPNIKSENEIGVMTWVAQNTSIQIPTLVAHDTSPINVLGYEYTLLSWCPGVTLKDCFSELSERQVDGVLDQFADILVQLHAHQWTTIGGLRCNDDGEIVVGRVVDETFWRTHDLDAWPPGVNTTALNIGGPYMSYIELISAQISKYIELILIHEKLSFMRKYIPRLRAFQDVLPKHAVELNDTKLVLAHKDLHFANILYDVASEKITAVLDWEFAGVVPMPMWNPRNAFLWNGLYNEQSKVEQRKLRARFEQRCLERNLPVLEGATFSSPLQESMQNVADYLRAVTEVVPRGQKEEPVLEWVEMMLTNIAAFGV